jgi:hypothetical protein
MPRGAAIALAVVSLVWLCGCGVAMRIATGASTAPVPPRHSFTVTSPADYAALTPGRVAALRVMVTAR